VLLCGYEDLSNRRFLIFRKIGTREPSVPYFEKMGKFRTAGPGFVGALQRENRRFLSFRKIAKRGPPNPDF
jgi:hypothetical protein